MISTGCCHDFDKILPWFQQYLAMIATRCCHDFNKILPWFQQYILPWFRQDLAMISTIYLGMISTRSCHDFNKILACMISTRSCHTVYLVNQFSSMNIQPHKTLFKFSIKLTVTTVNVSVINQPQPPLRFMNWVVFFILISALACKCMSTLNSSESTLCKKNTTYTYNLDRF